MTTIVCKVEKNNVILLADSLITESERFNKMKSSLKINKIYKLDEFRIAFAGDMMYTHIIKEFLSQHIQELITGNDFELKVVAEIKKTIQNYIGSSLPSYTELSGIFTYQNRAFEFDIESGALFEINDFQALGTGAIYALTALHLGHSPQEALEIACKLDPYSEL